jgi:hypothetical protein
MGDLLKRHDVGLAGRQSGGLLGQARRARATFQVITLIAREGQ